MGNMLSGDQIELVSIPARGALRGSIGHACAIEHALSMVNDGNIHVISDSDTVVVAKGWDDYVRIKVLDENIGCMGTTYEKIGGHSSGRGNIQTYKDIPNFSWFVMSPKFPWPLLNPQPRKDKHVDITDEKLSKVYNLPLNYRVYCDVGWQVPEFLNTNSIPYYGWLQVKPSETKCVVIKGLSDYHEEYHADSVPFIVHQRGSMTHAYRTAKLSKSFYDYTDLHLVQEALAPQKWTRDTEDGEEQQQNNRITTAITASENNQIIKQSVPRLPKARASEWMKISHNAKMIRPRGPIDRVSSESAFFIVTPGLISHLRVEGSLNELHGVTLPKIVNDPYVVSFRNITNDDLEVSSGSTKTTIVPMGEIWLLLVDIDGVSKIG
jgi:hypothetical protein